MATKNSAKGARSGKTGTVAPVPIAISRFAEYQAMVEHTDERRSRAVSLMGLVGEVGDLHSMMKKLLLQKDNPAFRTELREEFGDLLWYLTSLASLYEIPLEEIAQANAAKAESLYTKGSVNIFDGILNCAPFLRETIDVLDPAIVVTLGAVALKACGAIEPHSVLLREDVRTSRTWMRRKLIPVYHPGQRAMVHRSFANQLSDYQFIAESLRRLKKPRKKPSGTKPRSDSAELALLAQRALHGSPNGLSYFALHKLCFLAEIASLETTGERLTNAYVVRQKDGPYFVDLHLTKLPHLVPGIQTWTERGKVFLRLAPQLDILAGEESPRLGQQGDAAIQKVLAKYGRMTDEELKRVVYLSKYMRALLRKEKSSGANLYNAAVLPFVPQG